MQILSRTVTVSILLMLLVCFPIFAATIPTVTLTLDDGNASEATQDPGSFTVARTDDGNLAEALVVRVAITGTAQRDIDYSRPGLDWPGGEDFFITIPTGLLEKTVTLKPYQDNLTEGEEFATFTLQELGQSYTVGMESEASIAIADFADLLFKNSFDRPFPFPPINLGISVSSPDAVSKIIGPEGGSILTSGPAGSTFELIVPPGAVLEPTSITMTPITALLPEQLTEFLGDSFVSGVHFEPDGLQFLHPLRLMVTPSGGIDPSIWAWSYSGMGESLYPVPFIAEGEGVTIDVWHFSGTGISIDWSDVLQVFGEVVAVTAEQIAELAIENVTSNCAGDGCQFDPDAKAALISIFANWYTSGVLTLLNNAIANPALAKPALTQWLKWMEGIEQYNLNDTGALDNLWWGSRPLAKRVIDAAFNAATLKCDGVGSEAEALADFTEPWLWITYYLEIASKIDDGNSYVIADLEKCAAVKVSDATFPPGLDDAESGELKVRVGVAFRGAIGWTRYDMYPDVTLNLSGISAAPGSGTLAPDDDGWFTSTLTMEGIDTATVELKAKVEISPITGITYKSFNSETYTIKQKSFLSLLGKPGPPETGSFSETVTIEPSQRATIQATVFVDASPSVGKLVAFTLQGAGTIGLSPVPTDNNGLATIIFDAPFEAGQSTVTATFTTDTAKLLEDDITISYGASIVVSPLIVSPVTANGTIEFTATTTNLSPEKVSWTTTGGASIESTGDLTATWTAPADAGAYTITATSVADETVKGAAEATVELSGEPTGMYSEGFYYGRSVDPCEFAPGFNEGEPPGDCDRRIENHTTPAWIHIHNDEGTTKVEFYYNAQAACGWSPNLDPPWQKNCQRSYPHYWYRAYYSHLVLPVGSIGSTTTLPVQAEISLFWECYISCLSSDPRFGLYWRDPGVIRFGVEKVTLIRDPDADLRDQKRWIFVKDSERDPFSEWAFDPRSLETPEEYRN